MKKPLKQLKFVCLGMIITDLNGNQLTITEISIPSLNKKVERAKIKANCDLILQLDSKYYLYTDIGWDKLDERILVVNAEEFTEH